MECEKELTKQLNKQHIGKDRKEWQTFELKQSTIDYKHRQKWETAKWQGVTKLKKGWIPKHINIRHCRGQNVPAPHRAETLAEYLHNNPWETPTDNPEQKTNQLFGTMADINIEPFKLEAYYTVTTQLSNNKTPGPNKQLTELYKWIDEPEPAQDIIKIINECWEQEV